MTLLSEVESLRVDCGASGSELVTVQNVTGEIKRLRDWYRNANLEIQGQHFDWKFLWSTFSGDTVASTATVNAPSDLNVWKLDAFKLDGQFISAIEYDDYKYNPAANEAKPTRLIVKPDGSLLCDPVPDAIYTITGEYYKRAQDITEDADDSLIPSSFRLAIQGRAMIRYGNYEGADEIKTDGTELYKMWMQELENSQLPRRAQYAGRSETKPFQVIPE